jgi:SAM-dependent methyltransferase
MMAESTRYWHSAEVSSAYERGAPFLVRAANDLLALAQPPHAGRVLDIGSGTGLCAEAARAYVGSDGEVIALDPSIEMLTVGMTGGRGMIPVIGDAADLPFADMSFDVVTSGFVVGWIPDPRRALSEMVRTVREGGRVAISWHGGADDSSEVTPSGAWWERLRAVLGEDELEVLWTKALPGAGEFSDAAAMRRALEGSGLARVRVVVREYRDSYSIERFLDMAAKAPDGQLARAKLGSTEWESFLSDAREELASRFEEPLFETSASLLAAGTRS